VNESVAESRDVTLLELLDRIVDHGVVLAGDVRISVADVDLMYLGLRLILTSIERAEELGVMPPMLRDDETQQ
jgi:hypothetical protein